MIGVNTVQGLLGHIANLTGERQRPRLETILTEALRDITNADTVTLYKIQPAMDETLCWVAVIAGKTRIDSFDDGINPPQTLIALETLNAAADAIRNARMTREATPNGIRLWYPIAPTGTAIGLVALDFDGIGREINADTSAAISLLIKVFSNVMGLLDYSEVDSLTGLLNRKTFDEHLIRILAYTAAVDDQLLVSNKSPKRRHGAGDATLPHWLGVIDIDHFKRINDNFGHLIGDEVLLMLANLMRTSFRFRDKLFRFGGEEFVVVLKPATAEHACQAFERFRMQIQAHVFPQVGNVTISTGYAPIRAGNQPTIVIDHADEALYWVKANGRNSVESYEELVASGKLAPYVAPDSDVELF